MDALLAHGQQGREGREEHVGEEKPELLMEALNGMARFFPEKDGGERAGRTLSAMKTYEWERPDEREKAMEHVKAMFYALRLGQGRQAWLQFQEAEDRMLFDYSNKAIKIAAGAGIKLKSLAKLEKPPGAAFRIRGPHHDWQFQELDGFGGLVPAGILKKAVVLKNLGLEWHHDYIGEPRPRPEIVVRSVYRDPILAISLGRWILEVGRWE
jgi:hypothetical protein